jgi:hypothetical protein
MTCREDRLDISGKSLRDGSDLAVQDGGAAVVPVKAQDSGCPHAPHKNTGGPKLTKRPPSEIEIVGRTGTQSEEVVAVARHAIAVHPG